MTVTQTPQSTDDGWGNPAQATFKSRLTRLVAVDEHRVRVHKDLAPIVEHLLTDLSMTDYVFTMEGYPVEPRGLGLQVVLNPPDPEFTARAMDQYGFRRDPDDDTPDLYLWQAEHDDTAMLAAEMEARRHAEAAAAGEDAPSDTGARDAAGDDAEELRTLSASAEVYATDQHPDWYGGMPGSRVVNPGDVGRDVLFLQAYLQVPRTGVHDGQTVNAVGFLQGRKGLAATGEVNVTTWRQLIPRLRSPLFPGEHGRHVRLLSAAMIAMGELPRDAECSARYNRAMQVLVREMQERHGHRRTARVASLEWSYLLAYPW